MKNKERWETITMEDLISRRMAINEIKEYIVDPNQAISEYEDNVFNYNSGLKSAVQAVVDLPSVQPESKHGKWIQRGTTNIYSCSECKFEKILYGVKLPNYCDVCGAKMDRKENE